MNASDELSCIPLDDSTDFAIPQAVERDLAELADDEVVALVAGSNPVAAKERARILMCRIHNLPLDSGWHVLDRAIVAHTDKMIEGEKRLADDLFGLVIEAQYRFHRQGLMIRFRCLRGY